MGALMAGSPSTLWTSNNNYTMTPTEANNNGFTSANKFKGSSSDKNVAGKAPSLSCGGSLAALCSDTQGAPWYGASYIPREGSWDYGAYVLASGTQSASQPAPPDGLTVVIQ